MRQIKFRTWNNHLKRMQLPDATIGGLWVLPRMHNGVFEEDDNFALMQFTGLKDRHGIDIYEGDILEFHYFYFDGSGEAEREMKVVVEYSEEFARFGYSTEEGFFDLIHSGTHEESFEVFGNIHEHLELIPKH